MTFVSPNGNDGGVIDTDNGDNQINGQGGDDVVNGAGGDDFIRGGGGDDDMKGGVGDDRLAGGGGDDKIAGGGGDDIIAGGEGNDKIGGGAGDDVLTGGPGNNRLTGGEGADTFVFDADSTGKDKILDFELGIDSLRLNGGIEAEGFREFAGGAIVDMSNGGTIILQGISMEDAMELFVGEEILPIIDDTPL